MQPDTPRYFLALDATTRGCSVALMQENQVLVSLSMQQERTSSAKLTLLVEQAVRLADLTLADLAGIIVGKGPGSYTGLRIAVSTAKGLCFGLDIPLYSVDSLSALADWVRQQIPLHFSRPVLLAPLIDARRMEVYTALFDASSGEQISNFEALILDESTWKEWEASHDIWFFGDGALKAKDIWGNRASFFYVSEPMAPQASMYAHLGHLKIQAGAPEHLVSFEPYYLKEFFTPLPKKKVTAR